jgi:hypothetical protein
MYQPKTLAELARKVMNKNIVSAPHLRDLPYPQRFIRDLKETFAEDRLDFEKLLSGHTDFYDYYSTFGWVEYKSTSRLTFTPLELAALMKYPEEEGEVTDALFGHDSR